MFYAPTADGQVPPRACAPPRSTADTLDVWDDARAAAREFWHRASDDTWVSDDVRALSAANARALGNEAPAGGRLPAPGGSSAG